MPDLGLPQFDPAYTPIANRQNTTNIFQVGSTVYARKNDGTIISSGTVPETVIQAAYNQKGLIKYDNSTYVMSGAFAGLTIPIDTLVDMGSAVIQVPNAYASFVHRVQTAYFGGLIGGYTQEAGTPARLWTGFLMEPGAGQSIDFFTLQKHYFWNPGVGLKLRLSTATTWINGNFFRDLLMDGPPVKGVVFETTGAGSTEANGNTFENVHIECSSSATATDGFKDIMHPRNTFINCYVWDAVSTANEANLTSTADGTVIIGGQMTGRSGTYSDLSTNQNTIIVDWKKGFDQGISKLITVREGKFYPAGGGTTGALVSDLQGILKYHTPTGAGTNAVTFDTTEGMIAQFVTTATSGLNAGLVSPTTNSGIGRRLFGMRTIYRGKIDLATNSRFYIGFTSATALPVTDTPLATTDNGFIVGWNSADAGYNTYSNDGATSVTKAVLTGSPAKDANFHTIEIIWPAAGSITVIFDGTKTTVSSDLPATTANLFYNCVVQTTTTTAKTHSIKGIWMRADK